MIFNSLVLYCNLLFFGNSLTDSNLKLSPYLCSNPLQSVITSPYEVVVIELKRREGFSSRPYLDNGVWAIGYGIHYERFADIPPYPISEKKATDLLNRRLKEEIEHISSLFPDFTTYQKWALVSLSFNVGMTNIRKNRHLWEALLMKDVQALKKHWLRDFSKSANRHRSRELEWALFTHNESKLQTLHQEALVIVQDRYSRKVDFSKR